MKLNLKYFISYLFLISILLTACQPEQASEVTNTPEPTEAPAATLPEGVSIVPGVGKSFYDQVYCQMDDVDLIFDLHYPDSGEGPYPLVIFVHGGAWQMGDRRGGTGVAFRDALVNGGYAFAGINYRLAPEYTFPAMIEDVKCAVRFFRANAALLDLDADRFAALGGSAGGHLVLLLGMTADQDLWESAGQYQGVSSRVSVVVDMFGATDLRVLANPEYWDSWEGVFGDAVHDQDALWAISPLAYLTSDAPPILILQGDEDEASLVRHSQELRDALEEVGVPVELILVAGGGHGTELFKEGATPDLDSLTESLLAFLGEYLR
jgi:acetyl esterase/lipase